MTDVVVRQGGTTVKVGVAATTPVTVRTGGTVVVGVGAPPSTVTKTENVSTLVKQPATVSRVIGLGVAGPGGPQGQKGEKGDQGADAAAPTRSLPNAENFTIRAGQAVCMLIGALRVADSSDARHEVIGLALTDLAVGETGLVQLGGLISQLTPAWDIVTTHVGGLVPGATYFLSADGRLAPAPPELDSGEWLTRVGTALNATDLYIDIEPGIKL